MRIKRATLIAGFVLVVTGCASPHWDYADYDQHLYRHYTSGGYAPEFTVELRRHIMQLESQQRPVPPGLYAELGTLYFEAGDREQAIYYYQREYDAWPDSRPFMQSLITNLEGLSE